MKLQQALWLPAMAAALGLASTNAMAAGTTAGTSITNQASLTYEVGGTSQSTVTSTDPDGNADTSFTVDLKIDFSVSRIGTQTLAVSNDGTEKPVIGFTITNNSNAPVSFATVLDGSAFNGDTVAVNSRAATPVNPVTDNNDLPTGASYNYWQSADTAFDGAGTDVDLSGNGLNAGFHTPSNAQGDLVAADDSTNIFITTTDGGFTGSDGDIIKTLANIYGYQAWDGTQIVNIDTGNGDPTDGTSTDNSGTANTTAVEVVVAEEQGTNYDNLVTIDHALELLFPNLSIEKTAAIISDPTGSATPHPIPGAVIEYTLAVENTGRADASNVVVTDGIPANTSYVTGSITVAGSSHGDATGDGDNSDYNVTTADTVTSTLSSVATSSTTNVTFRVTID